MLLVNSGVACQNKCYFYDFERHLRHVSSYCLSSLVILFTIVNVVSPGERISRVFHERLSHRNSNPIEISF